VGRVPVSRVMRARLGFFAGLAIVGAGLYLTIGLGWALAVFGAGTAAAFVWLYDVDEPERVETDDVRTRRRLGL
jgi:membrane associated rhomboid family serine protease